MAAGTPPAISCQPLSPARGPDAFSPLSMPQRAGLVVLLIATILFGAIVEYRCTGLKRRMTDVDVYFRAAWAIRNNQDLYSITNSRGWHYHYPPLLAILLTPLAEPPEALHQSGYVPFAVSAALVYILSVLCLVLGVHSLAGALERTSSDPAVRGQPRYCRRWWALRVIPSLICVIAIGSTLSRGQVNLLLLALICPMIAAGIEGKGWRAGFWLAGAIALKIIPGFLLIYPLWRRDWRWLAGCAIGLAIMLFVIPGAVLGPRRMMAYNRQLVNVVLSPAVAREGDESRKAELTGMQATDNQSIMAVVHHTFTAHRDEKDVPSQPTLATQIAHWGTGAVLIVAALVASPGGITGPLKRTLRSNPSPQPSPRSTGARGSEGASIESCPLKYKGRGGEWSPVAIVMFIGVLLCIMLLITPVCHLHYQVLAIPLFTALLARAWTGGETLRIGRLGVALLIAYVGLNLLPRFPVFVDFRYYGAAMYANLGLTIAGIMALYRLRARAASDLPAGLAQPRPA